MFLQKLNNSCNFRGLIFPDADDIFAGAKSRELKCGGGLWRAAPFAIWGHDSALPTVCKKSR